jgi:hypothetical protein
MDRIPVMEEVPAFTGTPPVLSRRLYGSHISQSDTKTNNGIKVSYGAHGPPVHTTTSITAEQTRHSRRYASGALDIPSFHFKTPNRVEGNLFTA